jgi:hypothetical protein
MDDWDRVPSRKARTVVKVLKHKPKFACSTASLLPRAAINGSTLPLGNTYRAPLLTLVNCLVWPIGLPLPVARLYPAQRERDILKDRDQNLAGALSEYTVIK